MARGILDNHQNQKSSILALAHHDAFHFHVYMMENVPFEQGETCHCFTKIFHFFFFFFLPIGRHSSGCAAKVDCIYPPPKG